MGRYVRRFVTDVRAVGWRPRELAFLGLLVVAAVLATFALATLLLPERLHFIGAAVLVTVAAVLTRGGGRP